MNIGKEIAIQAKKFGLCAEWYRKMLQVTTYKQLADMYFDGDDWSMEQDFPTLDLLAKHKGAIFPYGMIVDAKKERFDNIRQLAFFGNSECDIHYDNYNVGTIIARHHSKLNIFCEENTKLFVNLLDFAEICVIARHEAEVIVYNYSKNSKCTIEGNVKIKKATWER